MASTGALFLIWEGSGHDIHVAGQSPISTSNLSVVELSHFVHDTKLEKKVLLHPLTEATQDIFWVCTFERKRSIQTHFSHFVKELIVWSPERL